MLCLEIVKRSHFKDAETAELQRSLRLGGALFDFFTVSKYGISEHANSRGKKAPEMIFLSLRYTLPSVRNCVLRDYTVDSLRSRATVIRTPSKSMMDRFCRNPGSSVLENLISQQVFAHDWSLLGYSKLS